jgi:predicted ester cyclase
MKKYFRFIYSKSHLPLIILLCGSLILISCNSINNQESANIELLNNLYEEGINKQNLDIIETLLADDYVRYCQAMPSNLQVIEGKEKMMELFKGHFSAFPNWKEEIEIKAVDGNTIAYISTGTGTQTGQAGELPPKGKKCELEHIIIHRFENEKIAESWVSWDNLALLGQLGHYPPPSNGK